MLVRLFYSESFERFISTQSMCRRDKWERRGEPASEASISLGERLTTPEVLRGVCRRLVCGIWVS